MLHSEDVDNKYQDRKFLDLFIRKNRDGRLGHIKYTYYGDYIQFIEKRYSVDEGRHIPVEQEPMFIEYNEQEYGIPKPKVVKVETVKDVSPKIIEDNLPKENPNVTDIF